jgi:hypothetical protein
LVFANYSIVFIISSQYFGWLASQRNF